jgi:hypothetical protein
MKQTSASMVTLKAKCHNSGVANPLLPDGASVQQISPSVAEQSVKVEPKMCSIKIK